MAGGEVIWYIPRMASKRSGTTRSYQERLAAGRPTATFSLPTETLDLLVELANHHKLSKSAVVDLAIRELAKKIR